MATVNRIDFGKNFIKAYFNDEDDNLHSVIIPENGALIEFTGKTDKNGGEIYDGDILEYDGERCPHCKKLKYHDHNPYVVKWIDDEACFDAINDDNYMLCTIWESEMKIIGNIYENLELLEGIK